jgi:DNA polymerase-3 subunit beta
MKFQADRSEIADAVSWALRTVGDRAKLPGVSGVRFEASGDRLTLSSTDLEVSGEVSLPVQVEREGSGLVPGRLLGDLMRNLPEASLEAEADADRLHLRCAGARFELRLMSLEDFPAIGGPSPDADAAVVKADEFARTVSQAGRAASADNTARPELTGVRVRADASRLTAVASDSYRLAMRTIAWEDGVEAAATVPRRTLDEARRSADQLGGEVRMIPEASQMTFTFGDRRLTTQLIEGNFPEYWNVVPSSCERWFHVERDVLTEVVKRVAVIRDTKSLVTPVTLHIGEDEVRVTADSGEVGEAEESLPGRLEGEPLSIAFNPKFLTDGLDAAGSEEVTLEFRDEQKPAVIRPVAGEDEEPPAGESGEDLTAGGVHLATTSAAFLYLLMPMRP